MHAHSEIRPVVIFAGNILEAGMAQSFLENAGIPAFLKDEIIGTMNPWWTAPGGAGSVKVVVAGADQAKAAELIKEYEENLRNAANENNADPDTDE